MRADGRDNEGPECTAADPLTGQGELTLFTGCEVKGAQSCPTLCDPMDYTVSPWNSPGQDTGVGSLSLLQGIFLTQELNPSLLHYSQIFYQLQHGEAHKYCSG